MILDYSQGSAISVKSEDLILVENFGLDPPSPLFKFLPQLGKDV